jgi:hypothetical protein
MIKRLEASLNIFPSTSQTTALVTVLNASESFKTPLSKPIKSLRLNLLTLSNSRQKLTL